MSDIPFRGLPVTGDIRLEELEPEVRSLLVTGRRWNVLGRVCVDIGTIATLDLGLPRDPRLLVPVDLRAYVVPDGGDQPRADVRARGLDAGSARRMPPPFTDGTPLPPGVHLHWALPDGLTRADPERRGDEGTGDLGFRPLPDRWLVARLGAAARGARRPVTAWVVEATTGVVTPLAGWRAAPAPTTGAGVVPAADLHPGSGGDAAWAAVYDSAAGRFGMHDPLTGVAGGRPVFSYVVVGWYSVPELDPLHACRSAWAFQALVDELGWDVDLGAMEAASATAASRVQQVQTVASDAGGSADDVRVVTGDAVGTGRLTEIFVDPSMAVLGGLRPTHPRQSLYHGTVFGVVGRARPTDGRPRPTAVSMALGPTMADATAALLADDDDQELLLAGFGHRLLDDATHADDWSALDAARHQRGFIGLPDPAPPVLEKVVRDEAAPTTARVGAAEPARGGGGGSGGTGAGAGRGTTKKTISFEFLTGDGSVADRLTARPVDVDIDLAGTGGGGRGPGRGVPTPRRIVDTIARPGPRYWQPTDPTLVLRGAGRTLRHGHDGRFEVGDTVACRLTSQPVKRLSGIVTGPDLVAPLGHGGVPPECDELLEEAALTDPSAIEGIVSVATAPGKPAAGVDTAAVTARVRAELTLDRTIRAQMGDAADLLVHSLQDGVLASPIAAAEWVQPWIPLYLEWTATLDRSDRITGWRLGELDLEAGSGRLPTSSRAFTGRANLAGAATKALADAMARFLDQEARLDRAGRGVLTSRQEDDLTALAAVIADADLAVGPLAGLLDALLGFDPEALSVTTTAGTPLAAPELLRAGHLRIDRLRLVDCFGQVLDLTPQLGRLTLADPSTDPVAPGRAVLPPRFTCPARIRLRFLDAADDRTEAHVDETTPLLVGNPVVGFLLPDHADDALEVFSAEGFALGQLHHRGLRQEVTWETPPGVDAPTATGPAGTGAPAHLAAITDALVRRDVIERAAAEAAGTEPPAESPLTALLQVIDTTTWTTDPFGSTGTEHTSVLLGRPVAVVRAMLAFDVIDDPDAVGVSGGGTAARTGALADLADREVPVRLGSLSRFDDGLLGFFVDDDYATLHPVHPAVREHALATGAHRGFLGTLEEARRFGTTLPASPLDVGYAAGDAVISVRPGQSRVVTLLVLPGHGVHVTTGVVPRKRLELSRSWIAEPLDRIVPSFRVGPVLVDPKAIRMPPISALGPSQTWTRRDTPASWRDDPISASSDLARLPDRPAESQEGWVRVRHERER